VKEIANIYFDTTKEPTDLFLENGLAGSSVGAPSGARF